LAKFNDGAGTKTMWVKVGQADWDDFDFAFGVVRHGAKGHDRHARFEWQQIGAIMTAAYNHGQH